METQAFISQWLDTDDIHPSRLDALFYREDSVENDRAIRNNRYGTKPLGTLSQRVFKGAFYVLQDEYRTSGIPFLRTLEIKPGYVTTEECVYLSPTTHDREKKTSVYPRDLVLAKTGGSIGYSAVVPDRITSANICQDLVGVRLKKDVDAHFVHAFISSQYGFRQAIRWGQGNAHPHLGLDGIREWAIPSPPTEIQRAIGNKIRKAERLREIAKVVQHRFNRWLAIATRSSDLSSEALSFLHHVPAKTVPGSNWTKEFDPADRVDPWPFHTAPRTIREHLRKINAETFGRFFEVVTTSRSRIMPPSMPNCFFISILDVSSAGDIDWANAESTRYESAGVAVQCGDILYSTLNPQEPRVAVIPTIPGATIACSPEFSILRLTSASPNTPFILASLLRSLWVRIQASFLTRSSSLSRRRLDEVDLNRILIPWIDEESDCLNSLIEKALTYRKQADTLLGAASLDIRNLIVGSLKVEMLLGEGIEIAEWLETNPSLGTTEDTKR